MTIDQARNTLSVKLVDLAFAQRSGDPTRIQHAQDAVEHAEKVLVEVTLRDEGGWKP
ncbi:hypothetical protein [Microbacterium sp. LWH12-1.2]|uniref:hypothetical protein n=1 Tax=Microbacterium sp. LWH12-1.2 TaxID=3135259 RepID=UPI00342E0114